MSSLAVKDRPIRGPSTVDLRTALKNSNPQASASDLSSIAELGSLVLSVLAELPKSERTELVREKDEIRRKLVEAVGHRRGGVSASQEPLGRIEKSNGTGLGNVLPLKDGRDRLAAFATAQPIENWAGPVAGAVEIERSLGIPRSTLSSWQQQGVVVGLLRGARKLSYPLEQFVDARPLEGLAEVLRAAPDARSAWLWLRQSHGALKNKTPLETLKEGDRAVVATTAARDFA